MSTMDSAFDDDGDEGRESQSSSDLDSRDGDLETSTRPPSLTLNAYLTPDARSTTSSVAHRAKEKLARLCGGRKCIVTNESAPRASIEVAHLLPRSTTATQLAILELAFGLRYRQMHIDTTGNLEHIKSDLHRSFDHMGWFLLPELHVLQQILQFSAAPDGRTYKQVFPAAGRFKYRLVPLQLIQDNIGIWRRKSSDTPDDSSAPFPPPPAYEQIYPIGLSPLPVFESLPMLESRANPFFVIANAGPKLQASMDLLPLDWYSRADIMITNTIWTLWMSKKPTAQWRAGPYSRRRRGNGGGGRRRNDGTQGPPGQRDGSPAPRRNPSGSGTGSGGGGLSGHGLAHTMADLPELEDDHQSASTESDILTQDAVRSVVSLDRTEFLQKWLQEDHSMDAPGVEVYISHE
ncbi:hypothetical protein DFH06DRAFT_1479419 [Mycena polygramma]|nr:hypothetical protein DFH06DRAFT_1479419 [Mycena polygramma]